LSDGGPVVFFFFSSRRRHTRFSRDWSSDVCSSDLNQRFCLAQQPQRYRKLSRVPMYRFGLPPESIKSSLVEVSGGKAWFPSGRRSEERRVGKECRSGGSP